MTYLIVQIIRWDTDHPPDVVVCSFTDIHGQSHEFIEKMPMISDQNNWGDPEFPFPGYIACQILSRHPAKDGQPVLTINTDEPWGICSTTNQTRFDVPESLVTTQSP